MRRRERMGAFLWMLCAQFFVAEQLASSAWRPPYSFIHNYISDLGATHSSRHHIMNGSFVLQGFLIGTGAMLLWTRYKGIGRLSLILLLVCAGGVVLVGIAPSDAYPLAHTIGAATHFIAAGLGICAMGVGRLREGKGYASLLTGIAILAATASLSSFPEQAGAMERVGAYAIVFWLIAWGASQQAERTTIYLA